MARPWPVWWERDLTPLPQGWVTQPQPQANGPTGQRANGPTGILDEPRPVVVWHDGCWYAVDVTAIRGQPACW
jgi:hypothetical protein